MITPQVTGASKEQDLEEKEEQWNFEECSFQTTSEKLLGNHIKLDGVGPVDNRPSTD